jgi:hypothetical protein
LSQHPSPVFPSFAHIGHLSRTCWLIGELPFPDYHDLYDYATADDELVIISTFAHRDRVRRIRIMQPDPVLKRLIEALDGEFPNLEYLFIERHPHYGSQARCCTIGDIPKTFQAPRLRYLVMLGINIPTGSPLFMTIGNPVALSLRACFDDDFHPGVLLQQLSVVPQREARGNIFNHHPPSDDIDRQLLQRAIMRRVALYLRRFGFQGANIYLETFLSLVTIHHLERFQLYSSDQQLTHFILRRRQLMSAVETPRLETVTLTFLRDHSRVDACGNGEVTSYSLRMDLGSRHLDWQVACTAQVLHMLRMAFSVVERLNLKYDRHSISSEWNNEADRTQWRELLRTFGNVKFLYIESGLTGQLSRSLQPGEGESPMDLLPKLQKFSYSALEPSDNTFASFIEAHQKAGHLHTVIRYTRSLVGVLGRRGWRNYSIA